MPTRVCPLHLISLVGVLPSKICRLEIGEPTKRYQRDAGSNQSDYYGVLMAKTDLTASAVRELLHYDPDTGVFTHIFPRPRVAVGTRAGSLIKTTGYRVHCVLGVNVKEHQLAWFYVNGEWPKNDIDHINGVRDDNRIVNLRDVTRAVNLQNRRVSQGRSGFLGVRQQGHRYRAEIEANSERFHLGTFSTAEAAHEAYLIAKRLRHEGCSISLDISLGLCTYSPLSP